MQCQVGDSISVGPLPPQTPFQPQRRIRHGPVIFRLGGKPKSIQAVGGHNLRTAIEQVVVIQQKLARFRGPIADENQRDNRGRRGDFQLPCMGPSAPQPCPSRRRVRRRLPPASPIGIQRLVLGHSAGCCSSMNFTSAPAYFPRAAKGIAADAHHGAPPQ